MDTIYSITSQLITPAVILNDRAVQVFAAIIRRIMITASVRTSFTVKDPQTTTRFLNFGGRNKFRRKSRPGLQPS